MDYSPWSEGKIWPFWRQAKRSNNSETGDTTPTKIGLHAFQVNLYLHEFFELILFFDPHGPKGKFGRFGGKQKGAITSKLEKLHPSKLVCMRFRSTPTCMNFLSQFYFLTPMDYSPWSEGKIWPFWRQAKRRQNL